MLKFLEKLQSADEGTKMIWIIIITSVIMVIVVYIWLMYFNNILATAVTPSITKTESIQQKDTDPAAPSFVESMGQRAGSVYHIFIDKIGALGNILKTPREYIVEPN